LVGALARGALPMCAMWVGFPSSFLRVGRKKQNKFPSNLHCPIKKLNPFYFNFIVIVSGCRLSFYTCCQRFSAWRCGGFLAQKFNRITAVEPCTNVS